MKQKILFDHIPKSAGTSLIHALGRLFCESSPLTHFSNQHASTINEMKGSLFIGGHFWFKPHEKLDPSRYYCTVLRDPVDRFISQYFFNREISAELIEGGNCKDLRLMDPQVIASNKFSLLEYLVSSDSELINSYSNIQAKHFAQRFCDSPSLLSDKDLLDAAISSLEEYDLVGMYDQLQEFIDRISQDFNRESVPLGSFNRTAGRVATREVLPEILSKLSGSNFVDLKLIEWSRTRFNPLSNGNSRIILDGSCNVKNETSKLSESEIEPKNFFQENSFGSKEVEIKSVNVTSAGRASNEVASGNIVSLKIECSSKVDEPDVTVGIAIRNQLGALIYGTNSQILGEKINIFKGSNKIIEFIFKAPLALGTYFVTVAVHRGLNHEVGNFHWIENASKFTVCGFEFEPFEGAYNLGAKLKLSANNGR